MSDVSTSSYRALLIPDPRLTYAGAYSASLSTLTQASPEPGVPEADQPTHMTLASSGQQIADTEYSIRCTRAGMPGTGAAFVWRESAHGTDAWRGWDPPLVITSWEAIDYTTTSGKWSEPHAVTTEAGDVLVVTMEQSRYVRCYIREASTGGWSVEQVHDLGAAATIETCPTIAILPSGRVLVVFWVQVGSKLQLRQCYSDDDGTTWSLGNAALLSTPLSISTYDPQRLRLAVRADGQALLVGWMVISGTLDDVLLQWASSDLACTFTLVDEQTGADGTQGGAYPDVVVDDTTFYVACLQETAASSGDAVAWIRRLGSAFHPLSAAARTMCQDAGDLTRWGTITTGAFTQGGCALVLDEDGVLYVFGLDHADDAQGVVRRSFDGGSTWRDIGDGAGTGDGCAWWDGNDASTHPKNFCATLQSGRIVLVHQFAATPGTGDDSLCVAYLGGYTTVESPSTDDVRGPIDRQGWLRTWLPYDTPDAGLWTLATTGSPTISLDPSSGALQIVQTAGQAATYTTTSAPGGTVAQGVTALLDVKVNAGNTGSAFIDVRAGEAGPTSYEVRVTVTPTTIVLRDREAGADLVTVNTTAGQSRIQLLIAVDNPASVPGNDGRCRAWYRSDPTDPQAAWVEIGTSSTLTKGTGTTNRVRWGVTVDAATTRFYQAAYRYGAGNGVSIIDQSNWNDLAGRTFSASPLVIDGVHIAATSGPAFRGDDWTVATRYGFGVESLHIDVSPSPRKVWRSTTDADDVEIVWEYSSTVGQTTVPLGPSIGLYLGNINFRDFELYGRTSGNTWTLIGTGSAALGTSLRYARSGGVVRVDTGGATTMADYLPFNQLAGSRFNLSGNVRLIDGNSEGAWNNATTKRPVLNLGDDYSPLDATGGTDGEIWSKEALLIRNDVGTFSAYKLVIPGGQDTREGYYQIGVALIGHVAILGFPYGWNRKQTWTPNTETRTAASGTRRSRVLGPTRRAVSVTWDEAHTSAMWDTTPAPDYVLAVAGGTPAATPADTPYLLAGLVERLNGGHVPVVYLPRIDKESSAADVRIASRSRMLYGRAAVDDVSFSTTLGDEFVGTGQGEVVSGLALTIEEEL